MIVSHPLRLGLDWCQLLLILRQNLLLVLHEHVLFQKVYALERFLCQRLVFGLDRVDGLLLSP